MKDVYQTSQFNIPHRDFEKGLVEGPFGLRRPDFTFADFLIDFSTMLRPPNPRQSAPPLGSRLFFLDPSPAHGHTLCSD